MIELFPDVPERTRENAETAWRLSRIFHDPMTAAKFLNDYTETASSEEERDFIQFYFNLQMELLKNE